MKRMRTINEAVKEIKRADSNSAITYYYIKSLCKANKIKHFKIGSKNIVDLDNLIQYLDELTGALT